MAVPGHDERDHDFALTFGLPIRQVVCPPDGSDWDIQQAAYVDPGVNFVQWLEQKGYGRRSVQYKLRDWLFSRQRYWGEPIPVLFYEDGTKRALELDELPLLLPELDDIDPKTGKPARRETNVMPQWAGSCWYYLRFIDPHNDHWFCDPAKERYWMAPYGVGEVEYTAFVDDTGRILSVDAVEENEQRQYVEKSSGQVVRIQRFAPEEVEKRGDAFYLREHPDVRVEARAYKMSKSRGNVVNPDDIVQQYGADALRVYEMFMGPLEMTKPWSTSGVEGVFRFLNRTWRMLIDESTNALSPAVTDRPMTREEAQMLHATIKKVREDIENLRFNTAIAQMMIFVNFFLKQETYRITVPVDIAKEALEAQAKALPNVQKHLEGKTIRRVIHVPHRLINFVVG